MLGGRPTQESERDALAERRARRAWLSSPALARRAEAAEATVHTLEAHLADLRHRQVEAEREREYSGRTAHRARARAAPSQAARVRRAAAARRGRRGRRAVAPRSPGRARPGAAARRGGARRRDRAPRSSATRSPRAWPQVSESCVPVWSSASTPCRASPPSCVRPSSATTSLPGRGSPGKLRASSLSACVPRRVPPTPRNPAHREEMAGALTAAVERLRARAVPVREAPALEAPVPDAPAPGASALKVSPVPDAPAP